MILAFRLRRGDDLLESIRAFARERHITAAACVSGVGCVTEAVLRDASGVRVRHLTGPFEIVSLNGTVSENRTHLHIALAGEDLRVVGGHLCPGTKVNTTCEVMLLCEPSLVFETVFDPETGYNEINFRKDVIP